MDYVTIILQTLLLVIIIIAIYLGKYYLPAYLQEKGKNLATKDDIEEITRRIETVRSQYTSDLEKMKSALQIAATQLARFSDSQRDALLAFFEDCLTLMDIKIGKDITQLPYELQFEYEESVNQLFIRVYVDYHRLILFFPAEADLPQMAQKIMEASGLVWREYDDYFRQLRYKFKSDQEKVSKGVQLSVVYPTFPGITLDHTAIAQQAKAMRSAFQGYMVALNKYLIAQGAGTLPLLLVSEEGNTA